MIFSRDYLRRTRLQKLRHFGTDWYVFRDDELSFSISGSKVRKYSTLIPYLIEMNRRNIVLIGGRSSNNICGLAQLLIESGLIPHVFMPETSRSFEQGNTLLSSLLIPEERWHAIPRNEWNRVEEYAAEYSNSLERSIVIPEGANHPASVDGAKTLAEDIAAKCTPDHVFVDSGTGVQAKALIEAGQKWLPNTHFHVVLVAGSPFSSAPNITFYRPKPGASFGSTPRAILDEVRRIAREEGFFVDPIYSAKLFHTARKQHHLKGVKCIVHSGGGMSLFSYGHLLKPSAG